MSQSIIGIVEQQRRDALVAWYLGQLVPKGDTLTRVLNENDLYEYLLIDNQVSAQVDTSRVAQGIASVQQHIHAIYNGMEPGYGRVVQEKQQVWRESMSQYSVWSANQMLADYPENYLQPTLRLDKTSMFNTFESELAQARLSRDTVQAALGNYLQAFETVSNLQITGCYIDSPNFLDADYYFVGRQSIEPFAFYWRKARLYKGAAGQAAQMAGWTEWKPVDTVMGGHIKHCRPVVMEGRLYTVWAESGKEVLDAQGEKTGRFDYTIKLAFRRLDDSWSAPIVLHASEAPDALLANTVDARGKVEKGYRLAVTVDHGNNGKSRLLVGFISLGFASNIEHTVVRDDLLNPLAADAAVVSPLLFMLGEDSRRAQFCADHLHDEATRQWEIVSVEWDKTGPSTKRGTGPNALNEYLELNAQWQNGRLALQGICARPLMVISDVEFGFSINVVAFDDISVHFQVNAAAGVLTFSVAQQALRPKRFTPFDVDLHHLDEKIATLRSDDFELIVDRGAIYRASVTVDINPDAMDVSGPFGGFYGEVSRSSDWRKWTLSASDNYHRFQQTPVETNWSMAHYNMEDIAAGSVLLNGGARTPVVFHEWAKGGDDPSETVSIYQWGSSSETLGHNGFKVTRAAIAEPAPLVCTSSAGVQYLDLSDSTIGAGSLRVRLNTLFAKELTRKASLSLENALSWETQHTEEPVLPGQAAPVFVDFGGANGLYFWELFFHAPHLVAARLQQEFDFAGAQAWLEHLFNPQMRVAPLFPPPSQAQWLPYWTCRPLGLPDNPALELEGLTNPDAIARGAPSHYRKAVFTMYLNNLIAWGDMLYRQVTRDTLNEAKLLYVRALSLLGPLSKGRSISLWESVTLKEIVPDTQGVFAQFEASIGQAVSDLLPVRGNESPWLRLLDQPGFRLPVNSRLLDLWEQLDLRLYNLRHNLTLDGKPMHLALYEAPVNPQDLLRAQLNGSGASQRRLGSLAIIPPYRFRAMLPRAQSAVDTLMRFAQQVLGHMEARDRAEQEELQQGHVLDDLATFAEQLQQSVIDESAKGLEVLRANRQGVAARKDYYDAQVRADVSALEKSAHTQRLVAMGSLTAARGLGAAGNLANMAPNLFGGATGGMQWGGAAFAAAEALEGAATVLSELAQQQLASDLQNRRRDEWQHQARQAELELEVMDRQIEAQTVALSAARTSLAQASKSREQAQALYAFLKSRATDAGLYQWLLSQMSTLYFQAYDAVLSMCLSAEACWQYEIGERDTRFISATAWVDNRFGLTAGETLKLGLLQMESAFLSRHERRLELSKTLSLKQLLGDYDPGAERGTAALATGWVAVVQTLRTRGEIDFQLKSSTFDRDYPGHYLRQLVKVSVSLPVVLKPYQDIHATLSQQTSTYLLKPQLGNVKHLYQQAGELPDNGDDDVRQDQLVVNPRANQQIGLSTGVDDQGLFAVDFGDERYLPFEGTGAISRWTLSFPNHESAEQQAMFDTLTDVILHIRYLAVDGGKAFAAEVEKLLEAVEAKAAVGQPTSLR